MRSHPDRDLIGYGRTPPRANWPGDARVAVSFVLNYEEGAERSLMHGDAENETYLTEIASAPRVDRDLISESTYEFGGRVGVWRVLDAFAEAGLPVTLFACGQTVELNPEPARVAVEQGHEVCSHGYRWIDYDGMAEDEEREHILRSIRAVETATGERPLGWYTGRFSMGTRRLIVEEGGFLYDSDDYSDELPFWVAVEGRPHLVVPYALDANDARFATPNGFRTGGEFAAYCTDALDALWREGATTPRILNVGLHARIIGRPGRIDGLRRLLHAVAERDGAWTCRRVDIARHWMAEHPPA
jgi:putative urate catabolism protein